MYNIKKLALPFALLSLIGAQAFAASVPVTATTTLILQNNTSGQLTVDTGQVHLNNLKADTLNPALPSIITNTSYHAVATQAMTGQNYSFVIPVAFPNKANVCTISVKYNADSDKIEATTSVQPEGETSVCRANVTQKVLRMQLQ